MATLADLDAAIAAENDSLVSLQALTVQLDTDVQNLANKVGQGQDFSAELAAVQSGVATLTTAVTNVQTADTTANPPPPPTP